MRTAGDFIPEHASTIMNAFAKESGKSVISPCEKPCKKNRYFNPWVACRSFILIGFIVFCGIEGFGQQTIFWRDNAANGNWENGNCADIGTPPSQWWYPGFSPNNARNRPDCNDGSTTRHNVNIDNNHQTTMTTNTAFWGLRSLTFVNTATTGRTINSSPDDNTRGISLTNGIYHNGNTGVTHTFNTRIGIDASPIILRTNTSGATSTYNREIFGNANNITFNGAGATNATAVISGSGASVTKNDAGTLTFSGASANTYTGATTVNGGLLVLNKSANTVAIPGALTANTGVTVRTDAANQWGTGTPPLVTLNGTAILNLNNNNQKIALASASSSASVTLGSGILNIDNTGTDTYAGSITGSGALLKTNTGTQVLSNTGNSYTGTTTVSAGTLRLGAANVIANASNVVMNGGTLSTGAAAGFSETVGTLNLNATSTIAFGTGAHTLTFANSSAVSWAGTLLTITGWAGPNNGAGAGTAGRLFVGNSATSLTPSQLSKIVFNISSILYSAVQLGTGEIVASGATPLYFGGVAAGWNTTNWSTNNAAAYSTAWTNGRHAIFNLTSTSVTGQTVNFPYLTVNENLTISTIGGTIGTAGQNARIFVASGRTADFSTNSFSTSATYAITKNGPGILALAGNTYGGGFTLNEGLVVARGVNAMGGNATAGPLNINGGTIGANATRDFTGKYSAINVGGDFTLGSSTAPSAAASNLTFNANTALGSSVTRTITLGGTGTYTWNGIISGTSSNLTLNATAAGILSLGGVSTYGGNTTINGGTLRLTTGADRLPTTTGLSLANTSGAVLNLNGQAQTVASLSGGGTTGGNITLGAGTLTVNQSSTTTYTAAISGTGGLVKTGAGVLTLANAANAHTGTTTITAGELRLNPVANASYASQVVLNGGTLGTTGITASRTWTNSSTLNLNANSSIALGSNAHVITFANSSGVTWAGSTLTITGWTGTAGNPGTAGRIFVGTTNGGLISGQLSKINFSGYGSGALILSNGEIVPAAAPVSYTWTGFTDGTWGTATNWSPNGVPGTIDDVTLNNGTSGAQANLNLTTAVTVTNITFAGTASFFTVGSSGAITALGNVTYTSGSGAWNCASTFTMSASSAQTIPPFNYGNLDATGGNRTLPSSGTVGICGTFTRGAGTYTITGSTVNYNGTAAQTISVGTYNNLTISNARGSANLTSPAGTISVAGTFDVSGLSAYTPVVNVSSIFDFTSASPQTIPAFFYGQLNNSGNGNRTWASTGIIDINQGFVPGSGTHTITGSTVRYSNTSGTTWNFSVFTTNLTSPARQYNNLIINGGAAIIWSLNGNTIGVAGNVNVTSGTLQVGSSGGAGVLNVDGNIAIDGANGILNVSASTLTNTGTINLLGNFSISAGLFDKSGSAAGTFNFAKTVSSPTQTISQTGGTITNNGTTWNLGTGSTPNVVEFTSNVTMSGGTVNANNQATIDFNTFLLTNGTFVANTGTTLVTSNTDATGALMTSTASGSVRSTTRTFTNAGVNYTFDGTAAQFTGNAIAAATNIGTLRLSNTTASPAVALTFTSSPTVATALEVNNGINQLGTNNITVTATGAGAVTGGSSTAFIQTNNTTAGQSQLRRAIATGIGSSTVYNFPVGTSTNYTPASFTFTITDGTARTLYVKTVGSRNTNDVTPTDYINNRYWVTDLSTSTGTYTYSSAFTYLTSPSDVVGTIGNIRLNRFGGTTWIEDATSSASGSLLTSSSLNQGTGSLSATAEWAGRVNPPFSTYTWDGSANNGSWDDAANWDLNAVPSSSSDVIIIPDVAPLAALAISGTRAVADFTVQTNGTFSMAASAQLTISGNYTYSSSTAATFDCSSTLILSSSSAQTLPAANYGNLNLAGGARTLTSGATTRICGNYTAGTSTTAGTSIVEFNGTAAQAINTNAASFATLNLVNTAATITANADVTVGTAFSINSGKIFNQASGILTLTGSTVTVNGTLRNSTANNIVGGTITFTSTGTYDHNRNSGVVPTATWNTGSNCLISGTTTAVPNGGLGQAFSDFTWNTVNMSSGNNLSGALTNVGRDLRIVSTGSTPQNLGLVATTAYTGTIGRDLLISGGNLILVTGANNNNISLGVTRNVELSNAASFIVSSGSGTGTAALNVTGTFTNGSTSASSFIVNSGTKTAGVTATVTGAYLHNNTGVASINTNSTATNVSLVANGGFTISSGTQNVSNGGNATLTVGTGTTLTLNGGTLIGSATAHTSTINANGNVTVSSGTLTLSNIAAATSNMTMVDAAAPTTRTMTISGTGIVNVAPAGTGTLTIGTNSTTNQNAVLTINGAAASMVVAGGGTGTLTNYGDLNLTNGTLSRTGGTATVTFRAQGPLVNTPKVQTITQTAGTVTGTITVNCGVASTTYSLVTLGSNVDFGAGSSVFVNAGSFINFGVSYLLFGASFTLQNEGSIITANVDGINAAPTASGSLRTTVRTLNAAGQYVFDGASPQVTGTGIVSALYLSSFNPAGLTLSADVTIQTTGSVFVNFGGQFGKLNLANFNLTFSAGTPTFGSDVVGANSSYYIVTNGTGRMISPVSTSAKQFPVGNSAYNPITLTPSAGTNIPYRVGVIDAVTSPSPNDGSKLINRYWSITAPTAAANTLTMNGQWSTGQQNANYNAGSQVKVAYHNGITWTETNSTQVGGNPFTSSGAFALSAANINTGITFGIGKDNGFIGTFVWNGSISSSWTNQNNWTPASAVGGPLATDNVAITSPGTNTLNLTGSHTITNFELSGTGTFIMGSGSALTINGDLTYSSSASPSLDCNSTINIANSTSQPVPAFNYGNLNATGGDRVLANSGTIGICGTFTRGAGAYTVTGSTVNYNGTGAQTISVGTYNNLTISNARGSANLTSPAGTISVAGTFNVSTLSAYNPVVNASSIFDFTSAGTQTIPAFFYGQLNNTGNGARTWASSGIIDINQNFSPGSGTHTVTGSSVRYSNAAANTFSLASFTSSATPRHYNNLEIVGGATTNYNLASGFNMGCAGNFVYSGAGTFTVAVNATANTMTVNGSFTKTGSGTVLIANTSTATLVNALNVLGNTTISSGLLNNVGSSTGTTVQGNFTTNNLTIDGTGAMNLDAASNTAFSSVTVNGNLSLTSTAANAINFGSGGANANNVINLRGNLTKSGTGTFGCTGTFNSTSGFIFNLGSGSQSYSYSGTPMTVSNFTVTSGSTLQLATNMVLGSNASASTLTVGGILDAGNFTVSPGNAANDFELQATGTISTNSAAGVSGTINGFGAAVPGFASGGTFIFTGTSVNTGMSAYSDITTAKQYTVTWQGATSLTLDKSLNLNVFNFTNSGLVIMGNFDISITSAAGALTGTGFGVSKMFVTNGTGSLSRAVLSSGTGLPFTWPIGENTGTTEYSPATVGGIAGAGINGTIAFRVVDGTQPNNAPAVSYITRYWPTTVTGFNVGYALSNLTFAYDAADIVVGPEASLRGNSYSTTIGDWTQYASSSAASNILTITSGVSGGNMPTNGTYDITARIDVPVYYRTVNSGTWQTLSNWEVSSDPAFISPAPSTPVQAPNNVNSEGITIRNHAITTASTITVDNMTIESGGSMSTTANSFTVANGTGTDVTVNSGGSLLFSSAIDNGLVINSGAALLVNGTMRQSGAGSPDVLNSGGTINIGSTGTYNHNRNAGIIPTCTWDNGSTCLLDAVTSNIPTGLAQSFHHFTLNTTLTSSVNCSGNLQTVNGNMSITTNHASNEFRLSTGTAYTLNVGGNLDITNGILSPASGGSGPCNVIINGTTTMNGSGSRIDKSGAATVTYTFNGDYTQNAGTFEFNSAGSSNTTVNFRGNVVWNGNVNRSNGGIHTINFDKSTDLQTLNVGATFGAGAVNWNVSGTSNTLRLLSNLALNNSTQTFTVNSGTTLDFQNFFISGGNTTFTTGATPTLMIGSPDGIVTAPTASGNIRTLVRTVNGTTTYIYSGAVNQNSGNLLPSTLTGAGRLTISNTGAASNNTVTLTNTLPMTTPQLNLTAGLLAIGSGQTLNITSGGTVNATGGDFAVGAPGGTINFPGSGVFNGNSNPYFVQASGGVNFGAQTVSIQDGGAFVINPSGFTNVNGPFYSAGSSLIYNTGGNYERSIEWNAATGRGAPYNVTITNSTNLNPARIGGSYAALPLNVADKLTINSGSGLYLDFGGNNMTVPLNVGGNLTLIGGLSGSNSIGGDINVGGNWLNNGTATNFFPNGRQVAFNGSTAQSIGGTNPVVPNFNFLAISNTGANVTTNLALTVTNRLQMNSGKLIIGNNNLILSGSAFFDNGGVNSYVVTNGTGTVRQQVNTGGGDEWYPIGPTTSIFAPVTLRQSGTTDEIAVIVKTAPAYTNAVNNNDLMVNLEWRMTETTAGGNNLRTIFGWQSGSEAIDFDRTSGVYHGHWNGTKYVVRAANATTGSDPYFSLSTASQNYTGNLATQAFVIGNLNGILPCVESVASGDWNTPATWDIVDVPPADAAVCLNHPITITTVNPPNPSGITFKVGSSLNISSGRTLTFQSPAFVTNSSGVFQNMTSGSVAFSDLAVVNGAQAVGFNNLQLNGNTTFTTIPTINGEMRINAGGFVISANGPNYGASSTLTYNTGGNYNRSNEWRATSNPGHPANVLVTGSTSLNLDAGTGVNKTIQGSMQVDNGSSISQGATAFNLTVPGDFTLNGSYTQSSTIGGDLILGGNWTSGVSASITSNNRDVRFNGIAAQTISTANALNFGFLSIDNAASAVSLLTDIRAFTFRVNAARTFDLTASNKLTILANGEILINGTFNANAGTIEYLDGGNFTNNGTFNRGTSTIDFLPSSFSTGQVQGSVQTNFHNIYLGTNSGIDFNSGPLRGLVSGVLQLRSGSFVSSNAPIYEPGSKLMYSGGGTFNRNVEWDPGTIQKVELRNNTTVKCGANGTGFSHVMADSLIIQSGSTFDMTGPEMTAPTIVGGSVLLRGTLNLSNASGGDIQVGGDWNNNGGTFNCNGRLTTLDGAANAEIKGPTTTTFCFLTINKPSTGSVVASTPVTISRPPGGTELRIAGGVFNLNNQSLTLGAGSNTLRINAGYASEQTLRTGGSSISGFTNYTDDGVTTATLGGRVDYSGAAPETFATNVNTYFQLWNTGGGNKTILQNILVRDDLQIDPSTNIDFAGTAFSLDVRGDVNNQGETIGTGVGRVILNGTLTQNMSGNGSYRNLDVNNTNNVNLSGEPTISNSLQMTSGKIITGVLDTLHLSSLALLNENNQASGSFVRGNVKITKVVGLNADNFNGIGVNLTAGANLGNVTVVRTSGASVAGQAPCCSEFSGIDRYWKIIPTIQPSVANRTVTLSWPSDDDNGRNMVAVQMWKSPDGIMPYEGVGFPQNVAAMNPRSVFYNNIPAFSFFTISDEDNPLPVSLIGLEATIEKGNVLLTWATASELNNKGFEVEKSMDGQKFNKIGFVEGNRNSNQRVDYSFTDKSFSQYAYYRLRQIDENGSFALSNTVYLNSKVGSSLTFAVFPNPTKGKVFFSLNKLPLTNEWLKIKLWDMKGRLVFEDEQNASTLSEKLEKVLGDQPQGIYLIDAHINNQQFRIKLNKEN